MEEKHLKYPAGSTNPVDCLNYKLNHMVKDSMPPLAPKLTRDEKYVQRELNNLARGLYFDC